MNGCKNQKNQCSPSWCVKLQCSYNPRAGNRYPKRFSDVCKDYKEHYACSLEVQHKSYSDLSSGEEAACYAAYATIPVVKNGVCRPLKAPHQHRLQKCTLFKCREPLKKMMQNQSPGHSKHKNFDDLFRCVSKVISGIRGVGELMVYDTALRLGFYLGLYPDKIYLHAGALKGAENLMLKTKTRRICKTDLPEEFQKAIIEHRLVPYQLEDILCIYKDIL